MKIKASEHQLQTQIINYLRATGFYVMRLNSGKYSVGEGRFKRFIHGQEAGTPDIMAFRPVISTLQHDPSHAELYFFEVKCPGNPPTMLQKIKMEELREYGAKCFVVHDYEEVKKIIDNDK